MKINAIVLVLLLSFWPTFSQINNEIEDGSKKFTLNPWNNINGFRIAPSYYKHFEFEASYILSSYPEHDPGFGGFAMLVQYVGVGVEYLNVGNQHAVGAKVSYEVNFSVFSAQVGGDIIGSDKDFQYRIMPRVGVSVFGIITAYYGWNYNLREESELKPGNHNIILQFNILKY